MSRTLLSRQLPTAFRSRLQYATKNTTAASLELPGRQYKLCFIVHYLCNLEHLVELGDGTCIGIQLGASFDHQDKYSACQNAVLVSISVGAPSVGYSSLPGSGIHIYQWMTILTWLLVDCRVLLFASQFNNVQVRSFRRHGNKEPHAVIPCQRTKGRSLYWES